MTTLTPSRTPRTGLPLRLLGAALALAVTAIHLIDQGGLTALKDPAYVGYGYWALEIAGVVCAGLLVAGADSGWLLAVGVAVGPALGYVLSRGPGLPGYTDDRGNWTEPIGVLSLIVEAVLLLLAVRGLARSRAAART